MLVRDTQEDLTMFALHVLKLKKLLVKFHGNFEGLFLTKTLTQDCI